jgi:hypothetical protein
MKKLHVSKISCLLHYNRYELLGTLTQTRAAGQETLVEILIVDGDSLHQGGAHADHPLPKTCPAIDITC